MNRNETKLHFKLYKAGRRWLVAGIALAGIGTALVATTTTHAATTVSVATPPAAADNSASTSVTESSASTTDSVASTSAAVAASASSAVATTSAVNATNSVTGSTTATPVTDTSSNTIVDSADAPTTATSAVSNADAVTTATSTATDTTINDSAATTSTADDQSSAAEPVTVTELGNATDTTVATAKAEAATDYATTGTPQLLTRTDAASTTAAGWVDENGTNYFYQAGQKANGYLSDGSNWYLFKDGLRQSDVQQWAGSYYYFDHNTYLRRDNAYLQSRWGDWYLFGNNGQIQTDVQKWAGSYYFFDHNTFLRRDNAYLQSRWGDYYLFGSNGQIQTDVQKWAGTYYYFDHNTYLRRDNAYLQSRWGDYYLFGNNGQIQTDVQKWAGTYYYFDHNTFLRRDNAYLQARWGDWYLFTGNGQIASGWYTYGGSSYYFDPATYLLTNIVPKATINNVDSWTIGDPMRPQVTAIDIASYQAGLTQANYNTMKALGIKAVIVKVTEGTYYTNPYAAEQISRAQNAGLNVAVYNYAKFNSTQAAVAEANYMATYLCNYGIAKNTLVIADMEDTSTLNSAVGTNLNQFWSALNSAGYTNHAVYTFTSYAQRNAVVNTVGKHKTWMAQYPYSPMANTYWNTAYAAWQVSSQAYLPGYNGMLDVSLDYNGLLNNA